jgi:O-Antigen ligase
LLIVGLSLLKTKRDLFFRVAPWVLIPLVIYGAVFWDSPRTVAQPIRAFRSQFGQTSERDRLSNAWRELEKINIAFNIKSAPVTGLGFGRPYGFLVPEPSLDATGFVYWNYITHNAIFWVWMKMGLLGFIAFWYLLGSAVVYGLITFRRLADGYLQALALLVVSLVVMQIFYSYGDLGLTFSRPMIYLGCMLGLLVRLPALDRQPVGRDAAALAAANGGAPARVARPAHPWRLSHPEPTTP